ncbi:hypothetical protein G5V59_20480 [Nocardioides sp. W3-2-3]|uniref:hypothetical protein n=1 Tax=Nocardioides convexus TaxID=2712224 RepID=UPI00241897B0|nr:hypothetical protein [Nocardioides convexus]NHA01407.1 hypothetical protein [Nocardioides convexus]
MRLRSLAAAACALALTLTAAPAHADGFALPGLPALPTIPGLPIPPAAHRPARAALHRRPGHRAAVGRVAGAAEPLPRAERPQQHAQRRVQHRRVRRVRADRAGADDAHRVVRHPGVRDDGVRLPRPDRRPLRRSRGLHPDGDRPGQPARGLADCRLSARDLTKAANPFTDICGGTYFFLDGQDRAYATTTDSSIAEVQVTAAGGLVKGRTWPLASSLAKGDCLVATGVDWSGRVWWFSQKGTVGTLDRATGAVRALESPEGEGIFNSVSSDETGGVYFVSTHRTYRLDATADGTPEITWAIPYDRGTTTKPGMLSQGSGTSPTLIGERWIAIADNAEPQSHVIVYDRRKGVAEREHCSVPVLQPGASTTENSLVAAGDSLIIENNYGYAGVQSTLLGRSSTPGISRVMIDAEGCHVAWTSPVTAPTSVPKASLGNGLVYVYSKPPRADLLDAWYVTAIDIRTGETAWSRLTGTGIQWNNHYASIYLGPDGALYVATIVGLVRLADGP